jgi:hypothetical protein
VRERRVRRVGAGVVGHLAKFADRLLGLRQPGEPRLGDEHPRLGAYAAGGEDVGVSGQRFDGRGIAPERRIATYALKARERLESAFRPGGDPPDALARTARPCAVGGRGDARPLIREGALEGPVFFVEEA